MSIEQSPFPQAVAAAIQHFPPELQREVADYVEFLRQKHRIKQSEDAERRLTEAYTTLSAESLKEIWDNDEDAVYDRYKR